jgi:CheY-like chemotaxis protein
MQDSMTMILGALRVLIVDDNIEVCKMIRQMLQDVGVHQNFIAKSGQDALKFLNATDTTDQIDIILCDWNMPGMTGVEFLRQVRSVHPDLPFFMITGNADKNSVAEAAAHGVTGYITKPFAPATLHKKLTLVAKLLAKRGKLLSV